MVAPNRDTIRVGQRGTITIPQRFRERLGLGEGTFLIADLRGDEIVLQRAQVLPAGPEVMSQERKAELLLNNAINRDEYQKLREVVRRMGLDPDGIDHDPPARAD
jgi:AbrB family looped-hinge helix DNA binding protein